MSLVRERIVLDPHGDVFLLFEKADEAPADNVPPSDVPPSDVPPSEGLDHGEDSDRSDYHKMAKKPSAQIARREVELQVSSKHLSLASKVFGHCIVGQSNGNKDIIRAPLSSDDCGAMQILLTIIYGLTRKVPRRVDVQDLLQLVILIDKYEFHEAVKVFTNMWFEQLRPALFRIIIKTWVAGFSFVACCKSRQNTPS